MTMIYQSILLFLKFSVLIVATHHSREIINAELVMRVVEDLLENFERDPQKTKFIKDHQLYFLPVLNVDGYRHVFEVDVDWRKNLFGGYGVDINRNYPLGFYSQCGGSQNQSDWEYKGSHPLSEVESFTLTEFSLDRKFTKVLDAHSRGRVVYCGYSRCLDRDLKIHEYIKDRGTDLARYANYAAPRDALAAGKHEQWHYQKTTFYAFLVETYEGSNWYPPFDIALKEIERVNPLVWRFLNHPVPFYGKVLNELNQPIEASIHYKELQFKNNETRSSNKKFGTFYEFLPKGRYNVVFKANGYEDAIHQVIISQETTTNLTIQMKIK